MNPSGYSFKILSTIFWQWANISLLDPSNGFLSMIGWHTLVWGKFWSLSSLSYSSCLCKFNHHCVLKKIDLDLFETWGWLELDLFPTGWMTLKVNFEWGFLQLVFYLVLINLPSEANKFLWEIQESEALPCTYFMWLFPSPWLGYKYWSFCCDHKWFDAIPKRIL